jgi:hypothetical protein
MVKRRTTKNRKATRKQRGAGFGFTGASSIPGVPGTVSNPQVFTALGDCRAVEPGYTVPFTGLKGNEGLPGMNGGKRRSKSKKARRSKSRSRKGQKGGRYTFDLTGSSVPGVAPNAAAWWAGTYPPVQRIACEGSTPNPLNPGPHTPSTQPLPVASANLHLNPQSGGATAPATVGVGDVDSMYYYAPTAGYDNRPSTWVDSVGAPVQLQIPFAAREMNPACITTGHPPPLTGALYKGGGILNTLKNSVKKVTNTIGLTKKTPNSTATLANGYNAINALNSEVQNGPSSTNSTIQPEVDYDLLESRITETAVPRTNNKSMNNLFKGGRRKTRKGRKGRKGRKH